MPTIEHPILSLDRTRRVALFCFLVLFYFTSGVTNRVESVDTLAFSADAEVTPFWHNHDARLLLFYRLNRAVYRTLDFLGLDWGVYAVLGLLGSLFAAGSVLLLYRLFRSAFELSKPASIAGSATLAFSYGFLRYANEVEVYIGAIFLTLLCVNLIFFYIRQPSLTATRCLLLGALSGIAVGYYQPIALALFFAATVLFVNRRYYVQYLAYGAAGVGTYLLILALSLGGASGRIPTPHDIRALIFARSSEFDPPVFGASSLVKAGAAILHDFTSIISLYGLPGVDTMLAQKMPYHHYYAESIFFAARNYPLSSAAVVTFILAMAWFTFMISAAIMRKERRPLDAAITFAFAWLILAGAVNIILNPAEREVWILSLVPATIIITAFVFEPLRDRPSYLAATALILLLHNIIGGLGIFWNDKGDLFASRSAWIRANADQGDWILTTGEKSDWFDRMRILRYPIARRQSHRTEDPFLNFMYFDGQNAFVQRWHVGAYVALTPKEMLLKLKTTGGRVFALDATVSPRPLPQRIDVDGASEQLASFGRFLRAYATVVADGPTGKTFEIDKTKLPSSFP